MASINFLESVLTKYPTQETALVNHLRLTNPTNWIQFAESLSHYYEAQFDVPCEVTMSSTWAVCQEFLNNLTTYEDRRYAQTRGGFWSMSHNDRGVLTTVSVRDILTDLKSRNNKGRCR